MNERLDGYRWRMLIREIVVRFGRGTILGLILAGTVVVFVGSIWGFDSSNHPNPTPWCATFGMVGFMGGCMLRNSHLGPTAETLIRHCLIELVVGVFVFYVFGIIAAERAVTLAGFPADARPGRNTKIHPAYDFDHVAVPIGVFSGATIGLLAGIGRTTSKRTACFALVGAILITVTAIAFLWSRFDDITEDYVTVMTRGVNSVIRRVSK